MHRDGKFITGPNGFKTNGPPITHACTAFATINGAFLEIPTQGVGNDFAHPKRGAGRSIDLVTVMGFDNLNRASLLIADFDSNAYVTH